MIIETEETYLVFDNYKEAIDFAERTSNARPITLNVWSRDPSEKISYLVSLHR